MAFAATTTEYTFEMHIDAPANEVFPLLCPVRENDWVIGWEDAATLIHSQSGVAELGAVFQTNHGDTPETWVITVHEADTHVAFARFDGNVVKRLVIDLKEQGGRTDMLWTTFQTGTSDVGNASIARTSEEAYRATYASLETMLQHYLDTGEMISPEALHQQACASPVRRRDLSG